MSIKEIHSSKVNEAFQSELRKSQCSTDRAFAILLIVQWLFCIACALFFSPESWVGTESTIHPHLLAAIVLGGLIASLPISLVILWPGAYCTRFVIASSQALMSGLIIHLMLGRIEAHFHIFGVLAFLSFYRDRSLYIPMVGIVAADHLLRGLLSPESIYGIESPTILRTFEHASWVIYETSFLLFGITQSRKELYATCYLKCELEEERDTLEKRVVKRTSELSKALGNLKVHLDALDRVQLRVEFTPDGTIQDVNQLFKETMGYSESEVIGQHHRKLVELEIANDKSYHEFWMNLQEGHFQIGEFERIASDGTIKWLHATYTPFPDQDGKIQKVIKYATDVTDRVLASKKSEEADKNAKELAKLITESPNELYIFSRHDSYFEEVNLGAISSSLYSRDNLLSMKISDLCEELQDERLAEISHSLEKNDLAVVDFNSEFKRKDGSTYPVRVSLHIATYKNKQVYVAFVTDITEIQKLEDQLSRAQKLESIGQLAAGVAHEINTPMQFIGNNIEYLSKTSAELFKVVDAYHALLNDDSTPLNWEDRIEKMQELTEQCHFDRLRMHVPAAIEESREGIDRTVTIVRAMREFSHPGEKEMKYENVNHLIESAIAISRNRWKHSANLELELDPQIPDIPMLVSEVNQVILNLIVNAGDAIAEKHKDDDGKLGLITVRTREEDDCVVFEVEDDGCGIPESIKQKIFDPFFTTKEVGKGTGQGLSITHNIIVNVHGGSISIDSTQGEGSTFTIRMPREAKDQVNAIEGSNLMTVAR